MQSTMGSTADCTSWGLQGNPSLPVEVWAEIVKWLSTRDAVALSRVNGLFYSAFIDSAYCRHIKDDDEGCAPLQWALTKGQLGTAQRALDQGADPNSAVSPISKQVPLHIAIIADHQGSMVKLLLHYGADPLYIDDRSTHIETAIIQGNTTALELLLDAEYAYYGASKATSMLPARAIGRTSRHANCRTSEGATVLHIAVSSGHLDAVRMLIRYGARVNARDSVGNTALHFAINMGYLQAVDILLDSGADTSLRDFVDHHSALDRAITAFAGSRGMSDDDHRHFSNWSATSYVSNSSGTLARVAQAVYGDRFAGSWYSIDEAQIHDWLISLNDFTHIEVVCDLSKNVDAKSRQGVTPLWVMCGGDPLKQRVKTWVKTLLDYGADINFRGPRSGLTPLMRAVKAKNLRLLVLFHDHGGCDLLAKDNEGMTALDWARQVGFVECAKMLESCMEQVRMKTEAR